MKVNISFLFHWKSLVDPMELFDEGEEISNKIKDLNDTVSNSLDTLKRVFFRK